jgi:hypothetical protein
MTSQEELSSLQAEIADALSRVMMKPLEVRFSEQGIKSLFYITEASSLVIKLRQDISLGSAPYSCVGSEISSPEEEGKQNIEIARIRTNQATAASFLF